MPIHKDRSCFASPDDNNIPSATANPSEATPQRLGEVPKDLIYYAVTACIPYIHSIRELAWMLPFLMTALRNQAAQAEGPNRYLNAVDSMARIVSNHIPKAMNTANLPEPTDVRFRPDRIWKALMAQPVLFDSAHNPALQCSVSIRQVFAVLGSLDPQDRHTLYRSALVGSTSSVTRPEAVGAIKRFTEKLALHLPHQSLSFTESCAVLDQIKRHLKDILSILTASILVEY